MCEMKKQRKIISECLHKDIHGDICINLNEYIEKVKEADKKNDLDKIRGFECERFGTAVTITKVYDCMLDGSDKRAAKEAQKCFQKISEESPESHIKLTVLRGGSKIEFLP